MKEGRIIEPEKIHLVQIKTVKGLINTELDALDAHVSEYDFNFDVSVGVNANERIVGILFKVAITALGSQKEVLQLNASYTHELVFEVENLEDFTDPQENMPEPKVDKFMLGTLLGIAYSTIRGIVYTRTQGTALKGVLLPVVDPKRFIKTEEETPM